MTIDIYVQVDLSNGKASIEQLRIISECFRFVNTTIIPIELVFIMDKYCLPNHWSNFPCHSYGVSFFLAWESNNLTPINPYFKTSSRDLKE